MQATKIQEREQIKYLQTLLDDERKLELKIVDRIGKASLLCGILYNTWANKNKVARQTSINIYEPILILIPMYGCEFWALTDSLKKREAVSYTHLDVYKRQV